MFICQEGRFCSQATKGSKLEQNECLENYFCPRGTAGQIASSGVFSSDLRRLSPDFLIGEVRALISSLKDKSLGSGGLSEEEKAILSERQDYLDKFLLVPQVCTINDLLPTKLLQDYEISGVLKCPTGTESDLGSSCLG